MTSLSVSEYEHEIRIHARELIAQLAERSWSVGTAESLTGGLVVSALVSVPGSSAVVRGGVVAYDTGVKEHALGVDAALLADRGAVDPDVARQMAHGAREALAVGGVPAAVGMSTTGIAGPTSPDGQPVGTVHVAVVTPDGERTSSSVFAGGREEVRLASVREVLILARDVVAFAGPAEPFTEKP